MRSPDSFVDKPLFLGVKQLENGELSGAVFRMVGSLSVFARSYSDLSFYAIKNGKVVSYKTIGDLFNAVNTTYCPAQDPSCPIGPILVSFSVV